MQGRLSVDSIKSAGNGPKSSEQSHQHKTNQKQTNKQNTPEHNNTKTKQDTEKWDRYQL